MRLLRRLYYRLCAPLSGRLFDRRNGIETSHPLAVAALGGHDLRSMEAARAYQPVPVGCVNYVLRCLDSQATEVLVDIGCGKGRVCFIAAASGRFRRVIGIDFSAVMVGAATENANRYRGASTASIEFRCEDARHYLLPSCACVVFLFNPFDSSVMGEFLRNNAAHFLEFGSTIAYANDVFAEVLRAEGFACTHRSNTRAVSLWNRAL